MLSLLSSGSLKLLKENERQRKHMRDVENHCEEIQRHILEDGRRRFNKMVVFSFRHQQTVMLIFRDTIFSQWKKLVKQRPQRQSMQGLLGRSFSSSLSRTVFSVWTQQVRTTRENEFIRMHAEVGFHLAKLKEFEETTTELILERNELQQQIQVLVEERARSAATIRSDVGMISGLHKSLVDERKRVSENAETSSYWEHRYHMEVEKHAVARDQNMKFAMEIQKLRTIYQRRNENIRRRTAKLADKTNFALIRDAFRSWVIVKQRVNSSLIKPLEEYGVRVADLERQLLESKRCLRSAEQNLAEIREQNQKLGEKNIKLESDLHDFAGGKGVQQFFRHFDLPRIILSMFRRLVVLGKKAQTPALGNVDNENSLLRDAISTDMCTHRRNKVSTKHEFQMYVERLYLTDVPPTHMTQVLCLLMGVDFTTPVSAIALQQKMSRSTPDFDRLTQAWRTSTPNREYFRPSARRQNDSDETPKRHEKIPITPVTCASTVDAAS